MSLKYIIPFLLLGLLISCGPSKSDVASSNITNKDKADILNKKGASMYKEMVENNDFKKAPDVKAIFQQALQLDPGNSESLSYIAKVDKFVNNSINKYISTAKTNMEIKQRTDRDDYVLCFLLQKASAVDPSNKDLISLKENSKVIREKFAKKMQSSGDAAFAASKNTKNNEVENKQLSAAIQYYDKGMTASTGLDQTLSSKKNEAVAILSSKIDAMFAEARDLISRKNYKEADAVARKIFIYNLAVDHKYDNGLKRLQYDINFGWANQLFDSGKFDAASDKVEYALRYNKTEEALSLQSKIQESKEKTDIATSFPVWLENIDDLIARQEYAMAVKKINYCELKIKDDPRKAQLEARKKRMLDQVETIYKAAVDNFVNENYEDAIDQFENVLAISPGYKDASNYLQEARSKEKILKSY